jgi:hypothetical protein
MAQLLFRGACVIVLLVIFAALPASASVPGGTWMFANRVALQIFDCNGLLCGRIVWLLRPDNPAGQPDLDNLNPDPALRQRHLCGLTIVWGMGTNGQDHWANGDVGARTVWRFAACPPFAHFYHKARKPGPTVAWSRPVMLNVG